MRKVTGGIVSASDHEPIVPVIAGHPASPVSYGTKHPRMDGRGVVMAIGGPNGMTIEVQTRKADPWRAMKLFMALVSVIWNDIVEGMRADDVRIGGELVTGPLLGFAVVEDPESYERIRQRIERELNRADSPYDDYYFRAKDTPLIEECERFMEAEEKRVFLDLAWSLLTEDQRAELAKRGYGVAMKQLNGSLDARMRELVFRFATKIVEEEIERRIGDVRGKVLAEVNDRWEKDVESIVQTKLSEALAKVRAEISR